MTMLKSVPALLLVFLCWPLFLGTSLGFKKNLDRYIVGFASVQALFFVVYVPAILGGWSSRTLSYTATSVITVVGVAGCIIRFKKATDKKEFLALKKPDLRYLKNPFFLIGLCIIVYQLWIYVAKEPYIYGDDIVYVRMITDYVDTNAVYTKEWAGQMVSTPLSEINFKYVFTSYYPFLGMISILTGLHPLILCKTIVPLVYLPTHYLIIWRIAKHLFRKVQDDAARREKLSLFMFFYSILIEFGHISYYTISRRVTIWIYNNKSDCFCLLLIPLFFYSYVLLTDKLECEDLLSSKNSFFHLFIIMIMAIACNSASLMGVVMSAIIIGIWLVIAAYKSRKPSVLFSGLSVFIPHAVTAVILVLFTGFAF